MIFRSTVVAMSSLAFLACMALSASALEKSPFTTETFAAAQKAGKSILVDVYAPWCSTCKAQRAHLETLTEKPEFKDLVVFEVDFDKQKDEQKALGVQSRSTLIAFKGEKETGRSVADTKVESIEALLKSAL